MEKGRESCRAQQKLEVNGKNEIKANKDKEKRVWVNTTESSSQWQSVGVRIALVLLVFFRVLMWEMVVSGGNGSQADVMMVVTHWPQHGL